MGSQTCPGCGSKDPNQRRMVPGAPDPAWVYEAPLRAYCEHSFHDTPPAPADVATDGPNSPWAVYDACRRATAPAADATRESATASVESMREAFAAWQMGLYPKGDDFERARVEWVPQIGGAPPEPFAVLCDGESVYLGDEWGAWQAALRAALRREKESRSDDSRPASGQGGDK